MTVYRNKQRGGEWRFSFWLSRERFHGACLDEKGKPVETKTAARAAEEREKVAARQKQNLAKSGVRPGSYTLAQACALHLARKEGKTDFDNHLRYVREIRNFRDDKFDFLGGGIAMQDITPEHAEAYRRFADRQTLRKWVGGTRKKTGTPTDDRWWRDTARPRTKREVNNYLKCFNALMRLGTRVRDPFTRLPIVEDPPEIKLHKIPRRLPRPIGDDELHARLDKAKPWTRETAELARLFGLRKSEALELEIRHIDRETRGLRFNAGETKSGNDEFAFGGDAGWQLLLELEAQAIGRGQKRLVTWPGPKLWPAHLRGEDIPRAEWRPLKGITRSWRTTVKAAGIDQPHRFHDVRARYVTEVAKVQPAAAQQAARHQDPATTAMYIRLAANEIRDAVGQAVARRPRRGGLKVVG